MKGELRVQARDPQAVVVYDNFNFMDHLRDQTLGNFDIMRNLTTGLLVTSSASSIGGLTQRMFRRHVALDSEKMLLSSQFRRDETSQALTRYLILNAISQLHHVIKTSAYGDDEFPEPPVFEITGTSDQDLAVGRDLPRRRYIRRLIFCTRRNLEEPVRLQTE